MPKYGPDRVHAQVLAIWHAIKANEHPATTRSRKKRKLDPSLTQSDGRQQLAAQIHSWLAVHNINGLCPSTRTINKLMSPALRGTLGEHTIAAIRLWVVHHKQMLPRCLHDNPWSTYHHTVSSFNETHRIELISVRVVAGVPVSGDFDVPGYAIFSKRRVSLLENTLFKKQERIKELEAQIATLKAQDPVIRAAEHGLKNVEVTPTFCRLMQLAKAEMPKLSFDAMSHGIPLIVGAYIGQFGPLTHKHAQCIVNGSPSARTIERVVLMGARANDERINAAMAGVTAFYLACDAGKRNGRDHLVKGLSFFSLVEQKVYHVLLDANFSSKDAHENAQEILLTLSRYPRVIEQGLSGQTTDCGGAVLYSLAAALAKLGLVRGVAKGTVIMDISELGEYVVAPCLIMHIQSTVLKTAWEDKFGPGGLGKNNMMQMLHTLHDLQKALPGNWKEYWNDCFSTRSRPMYG